MQRVVIVGCGSVGLAVAAAFATTGMTVLGYDTDGDRLARLSAGREAIGEPDLAAVIAAALADGTLRFSDEILALPAGPSAYLLAVPTPWHDDGGFDDAALSKAVATVLSVARPGDLLCIRSTVPVGTSARIAQQARAQAVDIFIAACPDRSAEGQSYREQFEVPHLIGADDDESRRQASELFGRLGPVTICSSAAEAEAAKLLCNVARDATFGLANELARFCAGLGLDGHAVAAAAGRGYERFSLPRPGPVGGPCLAKDVGLLLSSPGAPDSPLLRAARQANARIAGDVAAAIADHLAAIGATTVAVLGVAFKGRPPVADLRGSVALEIAQRLMRDARLELRAWDPEIDAGALEQAGLAPAVSPLAAAGGAGAILLANDHPALAALDLGALAAAAHPHALFYDLCGQRGDGMAGVLPGQSVRLLSGKERLAKPSRAAAE